MDNSFHIDLDVIAVGSGVFQRDFFRQLITGQDLLELAKEVRIGVLATGLEFKTFFCTFEGNGRRGGCKSRCCKAHQHSQHQNH